MNAKQALIAAYAMATTIATIPIAVNAHEQGNWIVRAGIASVSTRRK